MELITILLVTYILCFGCVLCGLSLYYERSRLWGYHSQVAGLRAYYCRQCSGPYLSCGATAHQAPCPTCGSMNGVLHF
jgi:hypothetical protein